MAKRYNSSFAAPSGFSFSARVGKSGRPADTAEAIGKKSLAPSLPERGESKLATRKKAA